MKKQRQPVGKWMRRVGLIAWAGLFLSNLARVMGDERTALRVISAIVMAMSAGLFIYWWRAPVVDEAPAKSSGGKR